MQDVFEITAFCDASSLLMLACSCREHRNLGGRAGVVRLAAQLQTDSPDGTTVKAARALVKKYDSPDGDTLEMLALLRIYVVSFRRCAVLQDHFLRALALAVRLLERCGESENKEHFEKICSMARGTVRDKLEDGHVYAPLYVRYMGRLEDVERERERERRRRLRWAALAADDIRWMSVDGRFDGHGPCGLM